MKDSPRWLIVRFRAIGDCVMAAWVASAIRASQPESSIFWAVESHCAPVIDRAVLVQRVFKFPRNRWKKEKFSIRTLREQMTAYSRMRHLRLDYGIDLQGHSKTAICLRLASPKHRIAVQATDAFAKALNPVAKIGPNAVHVIEKHLEALRTFGEFDLPLLPHMPSYALPASFELPNDPVTLMTGASSANKSVPIETWSEVAQWLIQSGVPVVAVGGPNDPKLNLPGVSDLVGQTSLKQTMAVIASSKLHLAADTGTGHIASAYGVPVMSVFGSIGHSPAEYRPWGLGNRVVVADGPAYSITPEAIIQGISGWESKSNEQI